MSLIISLLIVIDYKSVYSGHALRTRLSPIVIITIVSMSVIDMSDCLQLLVVIIKVIYCSNFNAIQLDSLSVVDMATRLHHSHM